MRDLTANQRLLLRRLGDAPAGEWVMLSGPSISVAIALSRMGLVKMGLRGAYQSGRHVQITREGRSELRSQRAPMAERRGLVETLLDAMGARTDGK